MLIDRVAFMIIERGGRQVSRATVQEIRVERWGAAEICSTQCTRSGRWLREATNEKPSKRQRDQWTQATPERTGSRVPDPVAVPPGRAAPPVEVIEYPLTTTRV